MSQRMALYMQDKHPIQYELEIVAYAEEPVSVKYGRRIRAWPEIASS